jgi:hypothetical protein
MEPRLTYVTLGVSDLERSVRFYRDGLGLVRRDSPPDIAFFEMGSTCLALYERVALAHDAQVPSDGSGFRAFTLAHNARSREEVERLLEEAVAAGAKLLKPAQDVFWGGYSGYFADPDGFLWEVAFDPHLKID